MAHFLAWNSTATLKRSFNEKARLTSPDGNAKEHEVKELEHRKRALFLSKHDIRDMCLLYNAELSGFYMLARYDNFQPFCLALLNYLVNTIDLGNTSCSGG